MIWGKISYVLHYQIIKKVNHYIFASTVKPLYKGLPKSKLTLNNNQPFGKQSDHNKIT